MEEYEEMISDLEKIRDKEMPDSPTFNYMNSLSPLKPMKRVVTTQTFTPLGPIPCVFLEPKMKDHHPSISTATTYKYQTHDDNLVDVAFMTRNPSEKIDDELAYVSHHGDGTWKNNSSYFYSNIKSCKPKYDEMIKSLVDCPKSSPINPKKRSYEFVNQVEGCSPVSVAATHIAQDENFADVIFMARNPSEKMDDERPSLDIDMASARWNESSYHVPKKCDEMNVDNQKSLLRINNTFYAPETLHGDKSIMNEVMSCRRELNLTSLHSSLHLSKSSPINPKKRSYESLHAGEVTECKGCNCRKSECLKLYCECFSAGVFCSGSCACQGCLNKPICKDKVTEARKRVESRNPIAFHPKVISNSQSMDDPNIAPAPTRHNKGCNCRKTNCHQKYCECYRSGVGCSISCRCEGCKNKFGRRSVSVHVEIRSEAEEGKAHETIVVENLAIQNMEEDPDLVLPTSLANSQIITSGLYVGKFDEASPSIPDVTHQQYLMNGG